MNWHDVMVMCGTAGAIYGSIRFDLKFIRFRLHELEKKFDSHMRKFHGD
jgi:hypothetical protein